MLYECILSQHSQLSTNGNINGHQWLLSAYFLKRSVNQPRKNSPPGGKLGSKEEKKLSNTFFALLWIIWRFEKHQRNHVGNVYEL